MTIKMNISTIRVKHAVRKYIRKYFWSSDVVRQTQTKFGIEQTFVSTEQTDWQTDVGNYNFHFEIVVLQHMNTNAGRPTIHYQRLYAVSRM